MRERTLSGRKYTLSFRRPTGLDPGELVVAANERERPRQDRLPQGLDRARVRLGKQVGVAEAAAAERCTDALELGTDFNCKSRQDDARRLMRGLANELGSGANVHASP